MRMRTANLPEGESKIAQHFSVGLPPQNNVSPEGTTDRTTSNGRFPVNVSWVSRPFGTVTHLERLPNLERLGYSHSVPPGRSSEAPRLISR